MDDIPNQSILSFNVKKFFLKKKLELELEARPGAARARAAAAPGRTAGAAGGPHRL